MTSRLLMMKAIVNTAPGKLAWQELPLPVPGPGQVRIRTAACGICATDLEMIKGWSRTACPAIPGHEWSGWVEATGAGVEPGLQGANCVASNVWADGGEVGFEHPGGYAECFLTEAQNVCPLPTDFPAAAATLIEPLAVSVRALRRLRVQGESAALVCGDGPIGLLLLLLLRQAGVTTVALAGGREARLRLAREFGAAATVNSLAAGDDAASALRRILPDPCPLLLEASGSPRSLETLLNVAPRGARLLLLGDYAQSRAAFPWNHLLHRELELVGSNASADAWPAAVSLAQDLRGQLARLVTHRLPAERFAEGMALLHSRDESVVKVVLEWPTTAR
jgi:threonine dehydrogenase-like Zn-dependent dehydrogenase